MGRRVLKKLIPALRRAEGLGEGFGRFVGPLPLVKKQVEGLAGEASTLPKAGLGAAGGLKDFIANVHGTYNGKDNLTHCKPIFSSDGKDSVYHLPMTGNDPKLKPWRQHLLLKGWVERWIKEEGTAHGQLARRAQCAALLGISTGSLKQYCNGWETPGRLLAAQIVKVFKHYGAKATDLVDDAVEGDLGVEPEVWNGADEEARTFAALMFHEGRTLTGAQRKAVLDLIKAVRVLGSPS